ncbi:MAG TPA: PqqD family protein [Blastocatellia bacterium]|nr:PqqD family protein [Blastocatellia bacterium]
MRNKNIEGNNSYRPLARKDSLVIKHLDHEMLVYDQETQVAHCLNPNAAVVWQHCDGNTSVSELSNRLESVGAGLAEREQMVWLALEQLDKSSLLATPVIHNETKGLSRRQMLKAAGIAAVIAAPVVTTIIAPRSTHASTCVGTGGACATGAECCSGVCNVTTCA